ncbi:CPBP family intramembrane metalloprotease [Leptospira langatensis]|uniref:CPBP family intramembrane metalloprotease n=1 Tax=Leptospira langatensis TaxID=2484983 RepID=A0A5F1ZUM8_9LEPT|nr:type II CAAX endopeptidase family protein [Leptospira langatensis]TGK01568.1 CPBP family intramembrane metalloprotease [Leptospira langatensis]TGL41982.1 CPBP family intramembrane metalloprotease [Leptospira langatensis]
MSLLKESLKDFFQTKRDWFSFAAVLLIFITLWALNYRFIFVPTIFVTLKDQQEALLLFFFLFYSLGALIIYPISLALYGKLKEWKSAFPFVLGVVIVLALVSSARFKDTSVFSFLEASSVRPAIMSLNYLSNVCIYGVIPLFWIWKSKDSDRFLGLNVGSKWGEIILLLGLMIPVILVASFSVSFLAYYPRFANRLPDGYLDYPPMVWILVFEIAYALGFVALETFFRGFMVLPFSDRFGSKPAVLAMAFLYGLLHFTKPSFEALGSFFGGFVLGMISYRTRSVYAGIIINIGVAWAMELAATLQFLYLM